MPSCCSHVWLFATLWTVAHQVLPSMGFSKQEYWSWLSSPSPGKSSQHGDWTHISGSSCIAGRFFTAELLEKSYYFRHIILNRDEHQCQQIKFYLIWLLHLYLQKYIIFKLAKHPYLALNWFLFNRCALNTMGFHFKSKDE